MMITITIPVLFMFVAFGFAQNKDWHFSEPNIAIHKETTHSPEQDELAPANRAVDGNINPDYNYHSCSHTAQHVPSGGWWNDPVQNGARWTVDLVGSYMVSGIIIYNRNMLRQRLRYFKVTGQPGSSVLYDDNSHNKYNELIIPIQVDSTRSFTSITITIPEIPLTLCEVKIFAACRPPPDLTNGMYSPVQPGYGNGSVITMTCNQGYYLNDNKQRTCQWNGLWSDAEPSCIYVRCHYPGDLSNGHYTYGGVSYSSGDRLLGDVITVVCNHGYEQTYGAVKRTCVLSSVYLNTVWNSITPTCTIKSCIWPIEFSDGYFYLTPENGVVKIAPFGTVIHAACNNGLYKLTGDESRTCGENGLWSGEAPTCDALCIAPNVTNGHYQGMVSTTGDLYEQGQHIQLVCDVGYTVSYANAKIACGKNHQWNGMDVECTVKQCPEPVKVQHGEYNFTNKQLEYNSVIQFSCVSGYALVKGNTTRWCQDNTLWSGNEPLCEEFKSNPSGQQGGPSAIIVGSAMGAVMLVAVGGVLGVVIYRKRISSNSKERVSNRHARRTTAEICTPNPDGEYANITETNFNILSRGGQPLPPPTPIYSNEVAQQSDDQAYYSFADTTNMPDRAIQVEALSEIVFTGDAAAEKYKTQFESFPSGMQEKHAEALKRQNIKKNRYRSLYAYDDTRVVLDAKDKSESDYINANYIHGFGQTRAYVASQGATKENINDIWKMIWQLDSGKIVMLTNIMEENKDKCDQYWPTEGSTTYGKVTVTLRKTEKFSDFVIRTLAVLQVGADERIVLQFHFTAWPDKSVPKYASSIVSFRNKVKYTASKGKGPIVVHCSAGIGRTGTFIAIDYLTEQAHALGYVDVAGCVEALRRQRVNMVQTLDQYIFIHRALVETLMLATSAIPSARFPEVYQELLEVDPIKQRRKLNVQFKLLKKMSPVADEHQYASAKIVRNRKKNRYSNILPVDEFMPYLGATGTRTEADYINAVFLPSYKDKRAFIITQTPLELTKNDFWRLIWEHNVRTIVMMNDVSEVKESEIYWPEEGTSMTFGDINVQHLAYEECDASMTLSLQIERLQKAHTIKQIQCKRWAADATLPDNTACILSLMEVVQSWQKQTGNHPIVVHCMNGAEKSGLFCAISAAIERLKIEQDVAISQVIEEMRNCREQIIPSVEQFQCCHEAVIAYMEQYETYSNFTAC